MATSIDQLTFIVPILVGSGIMAKMYRDAHRAPRQTADGAIVLRAGMVSRAAGAVSVLAAGGIPVLAWFSPPKDRGDLFAILGMMLFFGLVGGWLLVKSIREEIVVSDEGITARSLRGRLTSLRWSEVTAVEFKPMRSEFYVRAGAHRSIAVGVSLIGVKAFVAALERHLPRPLHASAVAKWREQAKAFA